MIIGPRRVPIWLALVLTLALAAVVSSPSFANGFLSWDDPVNVTGNTAIRGITAAHLHTYFTQPLLGVYSPLVYLSYALDYQMAGLKPAMYHATNLALHLVCVWLVYAIARRLTGQPWAAVLAAALFAVHPVNVAAVTPISVRSSLLYAAFYLAAYLTYLSSSRRALTFVLFLLAALSKPAAVVFPALMLVTDVYLQRRLTRRVWLEKVPFVLASLVIGSTALRFRTDMATGSPLDTSLLESIALAAYQLGVYAVHAIVPADLSAYYPYPERTGDALAPAIWMAPFVLALVAWLVARARGHRWLVFGVLFFTLHLALVLKLVPLGAEFTADRYLYVPLVGLGVLAVESGSRLSHGAQRALVAVALVTVGVWSVQSWRQNAAWRDDMTFYTRIIDRYPQAAVAHANRAATRLQLNDIDGAWRDSTEAIRLDPANVQGFFNRATAEVLQGRVRDARVDADRAIALDPQLPASFALRANIRLSSQDFAGARDDAARAIELAPEADDVFKPLVTRGMARMMLGDGPGALTDLNRAIAARPQEPALLFNRGQVRLALDDLAGGCADLRVAAGGGREDAAALVRERCQGR